MKSEQTGRRAGLSSTATKSNVKANTNERRTLPGAHKPKEKQTPSMHEILKAAALATSEVHTLEVFLPILQFEDDAVL
jgi:hypothetical protein